ncbi:MAG TPA: ferritin family protein, partial [Candidatus Dormibacteraeota bacterium]|nr:ferritin family protein [Candidatus Dormibacteraeota bacterium]
MARPVAPTSDAVERLLQAWHGEVEANAMYTLLADRLGDSRRGQIIREIAAAETSHRERIERRLRELGQPVPDPSAVKLSTLKRLQARIAPVEMILQRMEAAEELEITDRYKRSTGDPGT